MNNSAYYPAAMAAFDRIIQRWTTPGAGGATQILPVEAQYLMSQKGGPVFQQCVQNMDMTMPNMSEYQIEQVLTQSVLNPLLNQFRQQTMAQRAPGYGQPPPGGYWRPPMPPPGYGYGVQPPPGYWRPPIAAPQPGGAPSWYSGGGGVYDPTGAIKNTQSNPGWRAPEPPRNIPPKQQPKAPEPPKPKWTPPVIDATSRQTMESGDSQAFEILKFVGHGDRVGYEISVLDTRPRYVSDEDVVQAYEHLTRGLTGKIFMTIRYMQVKTLEVNRKDFVDLVSSVAKSVGNVNANDVLARLEQALAIANDHKASAASAFQKLITDEFNEHVLSGELTDKHPSRSKLTITVNDPQGILSLLRNDLDAKTSEFVHRIANFDERLREIVRNVLHTVVFNGFDRKIMNPFDDYACVDVFSKAIPPIWRNAKAAKWVITGSPSQRLISSLRTSEESVRKSALQQFGNMIHEINEQFTVVQVPRIITWTNCSSYECVDWTESGQCVPKVYPVEPSEDSKQSGNDVAVFLARALKRQFASKHAVFAAVPAKVMFEVEESVRKLEYGLTSDGGTMFWVGSTRYNR